MTFEGTGLIGWISRRRNSGLFYASQGDQYELQVVGMHVNHLKLLYSRELVRIWLNDFQLNPRAITDLCIRASVKDPYSLWIQTAVDVFL